VTSVHVINFLLIIKLHSLTPDQQHALTGYLQVTTAVKLTRTCSTIFLICGSKPMSSIRSASSSTRYVARCKLVLRVSSRSINLPGVAMHISAPNKTSIQQPTLHHNNPAHTHTHTHQFANTSLNQHSACNMQHFNGCSQIHWINAKHKAEALNQPVSPPICTFICHHNHSKCVKHPCRILTKSLTVINVFFRILTQ